MDALADYCDLCDLPRSQCIHGQPPPPPAVKAAPSPPKPRKRAVRAPSTARAEPAKPVARRWTPPETFKPLILSVLEQAGGTMDAEEAFAELESLARDHLRPGDSELTPEGEPRWRLAARRARIALIDEGMMTKARPGVWQLATPVGGGG